ncbi:tetratricopeptide repeat protein [Cyclobacterium salsum]|uniref:tetratricopeptide repeat protein n=1 Tax=Cyclobacterium salsum TaxID=2666329 RepID=UPI0013913655|nr:tetratricopeptide repeat protein [Cyclobacterium salsum]
MKAWYLILIMQILAASLPAQIITLKGNVIADDENPMANVRISVNGILGDNTDDEGAFNIDLSNEFISGERVVLQVPKDGWVINHPLDGHWNLPNIQYQKVHTTRVVMVPHGSMALWTHGRIEKYVAQLSNQITKMKADSEQQIITTSSEPAPIDFTYYLQDWAEQYGFSVDQVKNAFDQWATEANKSNDFRKLGLAAFYQKNFTEAAENFEQAARQNQDAFRDLEKAAENKRLVAYEDWKSAGEARYLANQFDTALLRFQNAAALVTKNNHPVLWAEIQMQIGNTRRQLGVRVKGEEAIKFLISSQNIYNQLLEEYIQEELPQDWAGTQNNLGNVLRDLGTRAGGRQGLDYLQQAVEAYQKALEVRTQAELPQDWAMTQNNLGSVLSDLGTRAGGRQGLDYLQQAVEAYQKALEEYTQAELPQDWAMTQNNLGNVLSGLGTRAGGQQGLDYLQQAVGAYQKALEVRTQAELPQNWAITQNNLGVVLSDLGTRAGGRQGVDYLQQAVGAYQKALEVMTQEELPQDWAMTQNNLGIVLRDLGTRAGGRQGLDYLQQAVEAFHKVLEEYTQAELPQNWAITQINLAKAYIYLKKYDEATLAYTKVLEVYPRYEEAYSYLVYYYHEVVFEFSQAFTLNQRWLEQFPLDLSARTDFAEKHFTTARFSACAQQIRLLLKEQELPVSSKIALQGIQIANAFASQLSGSMVAKEFAALREEIAMQENDFTVQWVLYGTKYFIAQSNILTPYRNWLLAFFDALLQENKPAIERDLEKLQGELTSLLETLPE